jgi:hypothetical protein
LAVLAPSLAIAKCFGGSNTCLDHGLDVINLFLSVGCELQSQELAEGAE